MSFAPLFIGSYSIKPLSIGSKSVGLFSIEILSIGPLSIRLKMCMLDFFVWILVNWSSFS